MARHRGGGLHLLTWCWALIISAAIAYAAKSGPDVSLTHFRNLPTKFFYFEDTTILLWHDRQDGKVYISKDEGKSWETASGIQQGKVALLIPHPADNKIAYALSDGTTHWRTENRGDTWASFETPVEPAWVANPLSFNVKKGLHEHILFQGRKCERSGWQLRCHDVTYYTKKGFSDDLKLLLSDTTSCMFAHSRKEFKHEAPDDLIYCVGFDQVTREGGQSLSSSRIFSSEDFFEKGTKVEELGTQKGVRGVVALAILSKYAVAAVKDVSPGSTGDMLMYVSTDAKEWKRASFPHGNTAKLRENAYTVVESTTHSLAVDVIMDEKKSMGTLFVSSSDGTQFSKSLDNTNRNNAGYVDFEDLYGVDGVGIANVVLNAQEVESRGGAKQLSSRITFDDGRTWRPITAPKVDVMNKKVDCDVEDKEKCSLHLHSVSVPHNFGRIFSSPAPGFVMGVGSIGKYLKPYTQCDTFLSSDAGLTWTMVKQDAHVYEFGDQGGLIVMMNDEGPTSRIFFSLDLGKTWGHKDLEVSIRARALTTISDSTSQKFLALGQLSRKDSNNEGSVGAVFIDFAGIHARQCTENDKEKWYAEGPDGKKCIMGHEQWYWRRKREADCYMGHKFEDPQDHEEDCACTNEDYECDFNYILDNGECKPIGPEPIGPDQCQKGTHDEKYQGSSGYRLIPDNTCNKSKGVSKDDPVEKSCTQAALPEGEIGHHMFKFPASIVQHQYFKNSQALLVLLSDYTVWQSPNEGYTWTQLAQEKKVLAFYMHKFVNDRAYMITQSTGFYTTNTGKQWDKFKPPTAPNTFGIAHLQFHPQKEEYLIWTGVSEGCAEGKPLGGDCHTVAHYTQDNGRKWAHIADYVRNCEWARDADLKVDPSQIMCERYTMRGDQRVFPRDAPLELVSGKDFFKRQTKVFDQVVGFTKFSEYLVVAEVKPSLGIHLQVSLDGTTFAPGMFPPGIKPEAHSFTILESTTDCLFIYMTMSEQPLGPGWGTILKSNSNGTYFTKSIDYVNRDLNGYVDFEKMIGIDGVGLINVVKNPQDSTISRHKEIETKITHNDGSTWKNLVAPKLDSNGQPYKCDGTKCHLHIHGFTERYDPAATYSTPSVPGMLMAVGNVGESLADYRDSDTFISRDAGFHWEEVHKDAHLWEFGDSGSVLVAANDEVPTDSVIFTTNEGLKWRTYKFSDEKLRVRKIITVPQDTSRKFILLCESPVGLSIAVQIDFSSLTKKTCNLDTDDPANDDFELWSPAEVREEACLFGRKTLYHRRRRDADCQVGEQLKKDAQVQSKCACTDEDFECEYNHERRDGKCVLIEGESPLPNDNTCREGDGFWYERTEYRKITHSTCEGGKRPDQGAKHPCPGFANHSAAFWWTVLLLPFVFTGLVAWWWHRTRGFSGAIRLPGYEGSGGLRYRGQEAGFIDTLVSIPWYVVGVAGVAWEWAASRVASLTAESSGRRGYRNVPIDEDAQVLRFEDEE